MNLTVSRKAEKFIRRMITFSGTSGGFRLAVKEGGCSGLSYDFSIEAEPAPTDAVVTTESGLQVFVPAECQAMLEGLESGVMRYDGKHYRQPPTAICMPACACFTGASACV